MCRLQSAVISVESSIPVQSCRLCWTGRTSSGNCVLRAMCCFSQVLDFKTKLVKDLVQSLFERIRGCGLKAFD